MRFSKALSSHFFTSRGELKDALNASDTKFDANIIGVSIFVLDSVADMVYLISIKKGGQTLSPQQPTSKDAPQLYLG